MFFLPTTTPGLDTNGLVVKSDNGGILKLKKRINSSYQSIIELIEKIQKK